MSYGKKLIIACLNRSLSISMTSLADRSGIPPLAWGFVSVEPSCLSICLPLENKGILKSIVYLIRWQGCFCGSTVRTTYR
jgi:hypothetical protein